MNTNVFLDLEGTIISSWGENFLVNTHKVREWLASLKVNKVHVFSFAVYNEQDRTVFEKRIKPYLSKALDVVFLDCPTVEDFLAAEFAVTKVRWETLYEFSTVRGKVDAFYSWCKYHYDGKHNILLDDTVPNAVWEDKDTKLKLEYVNVNSLT